MWGVPKITERKNITTFFLGDDYLGHKLVPGSDHSSLNVR